MILGDQPSLAGAVTQAGTASWARSFPGVGMMPPEIARGSGGQIVVHVTSERVPTSSYAPYASDDWLFRLDGQTGAMLWIEKIAPYPSMAVDAVGNVVLAWPTLLQKLDANGALLWSIPRAAQDTYEMVRVAVDGNGNIVLARTELDDDPGAIGVTPKGYLVLEKLGPNGTLLWQKRFGDGTAFIFGAFAAVDGAGNVVFWSAWVESAVDFGGGPLAGKNILAKYDPAGLHLWSKALGGFASNSFPNPNPVVVDAAGNILVPNEVGAEQVDIGLGPLWCTPEMVFKLDPNGVPQWNTCLPVEYLSAMPDGGFVTSVHVSKKVKVAGQVCIPGDETDGALGLYDRDGQPLRSACLVQDGYQSYGAVIPDATGMFLLAGTTSGGLGLPGGLTAKGVHPEVWTAYVAKVAPWDSP
jgi:outer membrane protein assembly factor BamB